MSSFWQVELRTVVKSEQLLGRGCRWMKLGVAAFGNCHPPCLYFLPTSTTNCWWLITRDCRWWIVSRHNRPHSHTHSHTLTFHTCTHTRTHTHTHTHTIIHSLALVIQPISHCLSGVSYRASDTPFLSRDSQEPDQPVSRSLPLSVFSVCQSILKLPVMRYFAHLSHSNVHCGSTFHTFGQSSPSWQVI